MTGIRIKTVALVFGTCFALSACTFLTPPKPYLPPREGIVAGEEITVTGSQNVYAVARKYNVSMRDLIVLNNIQPPYTLRRGQKLILPAGANGAAGIPANEIAPPPDAAATAPVEQQSLAPIQSESLPPVEQAPPPSKPAVPSAAALSTPSPVRSIPTTAEPAAPAPQQVASAAPAAVRPPEEPQKTVAFIWPVQGPVLSGFGPKGQGLSNDGVNIGAPKSSPVVAAANGIVVYAGNDMKGFGNLVLIRHQGGYITAYAHLDRVMVNKDAVVAQGDEIGTVGKTGDAPSPQLHFEIRYQGKPVDPETLVKKGD